MAPSRQIDEKSWHYHFAIAAAHDTPRRLPALAFSYGLDDMAVNGDAEAQGLGRDGLRQKLITSSTKRRIHELSGLQHRAADDCECSGRPNAHTQAARD